AAAAYAEACIARGVVVLNGPWNVGVRTSLAMCYGARSDATYTIGLFDTGATDSAAGVTILREVVEREPTSRDAQDDLVHLLSQAGRLEAWRGNLAAAVAPLQSAREVIERII